MKAKEKKETIEVFETYIKYIEDNLTETDNFLCYMDTDIKKKNSLGRAIECGFNNRMLPNSIEYIKSQRPTYKMNNIIYNKPCFNRYSHSSKCVWWQYEDSKDHGIIVNTEKIDFLKHLINKLKK